MHVRSVTVLPCWRGGANPLSLQLGNLKTNENPRVLVACFLFFQIFPESFSHHFPKWSQGWSNPSWWMRSRHLERSSPVRFVFFRLVAEDSESLRVHPQLQKGHSCGPRVAKQQGVVDCTDLSLILLAERLIASTFSTAFKVSFGGGSCLQMWQLSEWSLMCFSKHHQLSESSAFGRL